MLTARALARPPMLAPLDLALEPGSLTGLVGPNGAGKTTLLRALAGLTEGPGRILLDNTPPTRATRARHIAYMPADRTVGWPLASREVVALGLPRPDPDAITRALALTDTLPFAHRPIDTLSTGERARVLLARALVARPRVLLLDEPTANLDAFHALAILETLRHQAQQGAAILVSLHDLDLAQRWCDTLLLLDRGALIAHGPPAQVLTPAHLAATFRVARAQQGWARA